MTAAICTVSALDTLKGAPAPLLLSVAVIVSGNEPDAVGVPDSTPVAASKVRPGGKAPAVIAYVYGGVPPVTVKAWLKATPLLPLTVPEPGESVSDGALTVSETAWLTENGPLPVLLSMPDTVRLNVPASVGVPDTVTLSVPAAVTLSPAGRPTTA